MKFICDKVLLQEALTAASRASTTNSPNMMLANLLLIADENLTVVGNNLEISIEYTVPAQVQESGSICINSRTLCDIVRSLPDEAILFEETDKNIHITCGETDFKLIGLDAEDFPRSEPVENAGENHAVRTAFDRHCPPDRICRCGDRRETAFDRD